MHQMQILRFHPLRATDGLLEMVKLISTGCCHRLHLRHYCWAYTMWIMDVLQTAQLVTFDAKKIGVPCAELCQWGEKCDNPHNYVWEEHLRTVKVTKNGQPRVILNCDEISFDLESVTWAIFESEFQLICLIAKCCVTWVGNDIP